MLVPLEGMLFTQIIGSLQYIQPNGAKLPKKMPWKDENLPTLGVVCSNMFYFTRSWRRRPIWLIPSKIEWDLTNGPLSKLLELLGTQV